MRHRVPGGNDRYYRENSRQDYQEQGNAVNPHVVVDSHSHYPRDINLELHAVGHDIKLSVDPERPQESNKGNNQTDTFDGGMLV